MTKTLEQVRQRLSAEQQPEKAAFFPRFFKSGPGEYGEGDQFLGIIVPALRQIAREYWKQLTMEEVELLFRSPWHEERLLAAMVLVMRYEKSKNPIDQAGLVDYYLSQVAQDRVNNWDLVDLSAEKILGAWLCTKPDRSILYTLAGKEHLWSQRVAVISTFAFIRRNDFKDLLALCELLLDHPHDLIHKACGWMLREAGKRDEQVLLNFLEEFYPRIPRTMLRYAIEKLDEPLRKQILKGNW